MAFEDQSGLFSCISLESKKYPLRQVRALVREVLGEPNRSLDVHKFIDVLFTAIWGRLTADDLAEVDLMYALPHFHAFVRQRRFLAN